jgi:hypothetical protein
VSGYLTNSLENCMTKPRAGRGRPAFNPTPAMRRTVERMVACGDSQNTIARAIGIEDDTLRKHFDEELKNGYAKKRREVLNWMYEGARKGNATLIKRLEEMTRLAGAAADFDRAGDKPETPAAPQPRVRRMGKKEQLREDALTAGVDNEWGDDLAPPSGAVN